MLPGKAAIEAAGLPYHDPEEKEPPRHVDYDAVPPELNP
jgi:hypothetical protein